MESNCNKNVPGSRSSCGASDRSNCNSMKCGNEGMLYNCERQKGNCDRAVMRQDRMTQPYRREGNVRTGYERGRVEMTRNLRGNQENHGKNMEIECVCQMTQVSDCHRHDEMEQLGCDFPLVMAYVPWQQWGDLYEADKGLMQGTIFKDLNFIFCGERC